MNAILVILLVTGVAVAASYLLIKLGKVEDKDKDLIPDAVEEAVEEVKEKIEDVKQDVDKKVKEVKRRAKRVKEEVKDVVEAVKEVGNQAEDVVDAAKGKPRKGRKPAAKQAQQDNPTPKKRTRRRTSKKTS